VKPTPFFSFAFLLLGISTASAQLYLPVGINTGVTAHFNFTINTISNQLLLQVDNRFAGAGGATGTITSFGFNVPNGLIVSTRLVSQSWNVLTPGRTEPGDWTLVAPYALNAGGNNFGQDVGLITGPNANGGNPPKGIWFGEVISFVFQFDDFTVVTGFLGENGVTARWQSIASSGNSNRDSASDEGFGSFIAPPVPEPSTYGLAGVGALLLGVAVQRRRGRRGSAA
jgi:hypothetical protein